MRISSSFNGALNYHVNKGRGEVTEVDLTATMVSSPEIFCYSLLVFTCNDSISLLTTSWAPDGDGSKGNFKA